MSEIRNYCILITSEVIESIWVLAESAKQALEIAQVAHSNGTHGHQQIDRTVRKTEIIGEREVLR